MSGRGNGTGSHESLGFLKDSESQALQWMADVLEWPTEPIGISIYGRWIPEKPDHGQFYLNIGYQVLDNLRVGLDLRPKTDDLGILVNWRVFAEDDNWRPAFIVGTSNDDFGTINSQSFYGTFSKRLFDVGGIHVSPYAGATYIEALSEIRPVGGLHLRKGAWSAMLMYSGVDEHVSISRDFGNHTITFLLFNMKLPGIAYGFRF